MVLPAVIGRVALHTLGSAGLEAVADEHVVDATPVAVVRGPSDVAGVLVALVRELAQRVARGVVVPDGVVEVARDHQRLVAGEPLGDGAYVADLLALGRRADAVVVGVRRGVAEVLGKIGAPSANRLPMRGPR